MNEIDLHGLRMSEALERFVEAHNSLSGGRGASLKVIHGYGSSGSGGEIRAAIRNLLKQNPASSDYIRGEEMDGNPGYTVVYPKRRLPTGVDRLWDAIMEYCASPRSQQEVLTKFVRRSGEPEVNRAIRELEHRGRLRSFLKNGRKHYVDSNRLAR